jgi:hypothetical protein
VEARVACTLAVSAEECPAAPCCRDGPGNKNEEPIHGRARKSPVAVLNVLADGTNMRQWWSARCIATVSDSNSPKVHRREGQLTTVQIKPDIFTMSRCTSADLFFSCCDSVAVADLCELQRAHPPTPSALCSAPKAREAGVVKPLNFPVWDTRVRATGIFSFSCQTTTLSFLRFFAPPRPFSPACSPPPRLFFARDCAHAGAPVR